MVETRACPLGLDGPLFSFPCAERVLPMQTIALLVLMSAGACGELHRTDCGECSRPKAPARTAWKEFWCNIARPCDIRMTKDYWPLEYPGARGRGWQAHGVAVTRDTPINVGPHAVRVTFDEFGVPIAIREDAGEIAAGPRPATPAEPVPPPAAPGMREGRHRTDTPSHSRFRLITE